MTETMGPILDDLRAVQVDAVKPVEVAPGVIRRRLPGTGRADGWLYDLVPGVAWPEAALHPGEERCYYVLFGELIDRDRRLGPGSYLVLGPGSPYRPRTETGARVLGVSIAP
ncbi:hypothetical protein LO763_02885 [Glycomyces sp. A-F 0318]|uniref:hypothetical protein n=1 Tax=Glycomyces amatae TaxID=2881355 RepID=UPI001E5DCA39|nr:hypothetical protein [Glycomyces amatae]MCD0442569.1 hypothetical protein [Glycomyces amatae]